MFSIEENNILYGPILDIVVSKHIKCNMLFINIRRVE